MPVMSALSRAPVDAEPACACFLSEHSERFPFVFQRFAQALARPAAAGLSAMTGLRLERLDPAATRDPQKSLDQAIERAPLFIADITPSLVGGSARWDANVAYAIGRAHQAQRPVFTICDRQFHPKAGADARPWHVATASVHWYAFSPQGLDAVLRKFKAWLASGAVSRIEQRVPGAGAAPPRGKRARRRATDLPARMTLGNRAVEGRVTSLSRSGAFFVPRSLPGEEMAQAEPTRLSLIKGRKTEHRDVELRRVGQTATPNVLGFGVRFVRPAPRQ